MSRRVVPDDEPMWKALADPTRRAILDRLRAGPRTTGVLAAAFPTTRYTVMGHLDVLVDVGLVSVERRGRERLNHLNPVPLERAYRRWVQPLAAAAADTLLQLDEALEDGVSVTNSGSVGGLSMDVRAQHRVSADPDRTWQAVLELPRWWPRRWSEDRRLVFEPRVGGRLGPAAVAAGQAERVAAAADFADGAEGELWGVVTVLRPRQLLVVDGSMGMTGPVLGQWRLLVEPADVKAAATTVTVEHRVLGAVVEDDRQCYATGWEETLTSLAAFAEDPGWWGV